MITAPPLCVACHQCHSLSSKQLAQAKPTRPHPLQKPKRAQGRPLWARKESSPLALVSTHRAPDTDRVAGTEFRFFLLTRSLTLFPQLSLTPRP